MIIYSYLPVTAPRAKMMKSSCSKSIMLDAFFFLENLSEEWKLSLQNTPNISNWKCFNNIAQYLLENKPSWNYFFDSL